MKRFFIFASALAMSAALAEAKTFVYCSEASPEGFDPAPYTAGGTFDASAHPVFNRLVQAHSVGNWLWGVVDWKTVDETYHKLVSAILMMG